MAKKPGRIKRLLQFLFGLAVILGILGYWAFKQLQPTGAGKAFFVRYDSPLPVKTVLTDLQKRGVVRDAMVADFYSRLLRKPRQIRRGTYEFRPGMKIEEVYKSMENPIRQMVRLPEVFWASRTAKILEEKGVTTNDDYMKWVNDPQAFQSYVSFPLPKTGSLEGYLYPDTYDLPPMLGAKETIIRQLKTFEQKVFKKLPPKTDLRRALTIGSMVQLEVMLDNERPKVAGVIENRVKQKMPLQIDATVLYGLQEWRRLTFKDYKETDSPYNTYRIKGLPPGPICSPTLPNVLAALNPDKHPYVYYVALPEGRHLFSSTYAEHLKNIEKRKAALKMQAQKTP